MKNYGKKCIIILSIIFVVSLLSGCQQESSRVKEAREQEKLSLHALNTVGMPAVKNMREMRILKDIIELRDQMDLNTYTYLVAEQTGKLSFLGESIGYGIPAATQYTNPMKLANGYGQDTAIPMADPNGLYAPSSAEGTWVLMKNPNKDEIKPVYIEARIVVTPFKMH